MKPDSIIQAAVRATLAVLSFFVGIASASGQGAQPGTITTYAGPVLLDSTTAISRPIDSPTAVISDSAGGFYLASRGQNMVYQVSANGTIRVVAGNGTSGFSGDGGQAMSARISTSFGIAVDSAGNLYIADSSNNRIRKVTTDGVIHTIVGNSQGNFSGDGGQATAATLFAPNGVAVDAAGNLYIADTGNDRIRKVTTDGVIRTVVGNGAHGFGGDGGPAASASLSFPNAVAADAAGNLYIADSNNSRIRKVTTDGVIRTVAGAGGFGFNGDGGPAVSAMLNFPIGLALDATGNLYIADTYNSRIRKVTTDGVIRTVAGAGGFGFSGDGGQAVSASLNYPNGAAVDAAGNLYIADSNNDRIRKVTTDGVIRTVAGMTIYGFSGDGGPATSALLKYPGDVAVDAVGNLYIADTGNNRIRKVTPDGVIRTVAGNGNSGFSGDGGMAISASLSYPAGVAVDAVGNLYIADTSNHRIRKVTPDGVIRTVAGSEGVGRFSGDGGPATSAVLSYPSGVAVDAVGNLYIADLVNNLVNNRVRKVTLDGVIHTVAGNGDIFSSGDGGPAISAGIPGPFSVAVDAAGNLYIVDSDYEAVDLASDPVRVSDNIRKVSPDGVIHTIFSNGDYLGKIAVDAADNLYFPNAGSIVRMSPDGFTLTIAGNGSFGFGGDGGPAISAAFSSLNGITVDAAGDLFIVDGSRIRKIIGGSVIVAITPNSGGRGNAINVTLRGTKFDSSLTVDSISGITVSNLTVVNSTTATATFTIAASAIPGSRDVTVTTSTASSNTVAFTVYPPPTVTSVAPVAGPPGFAVAVTLAGTGFAPGMTVDAGSGINVSNVSVTSATSASATFTIASAAALGVRSVTATTTSGISFAATFNVVEPFPDLAIASAHSTDFGVGFTEAYNLRICNAGYGATTGPTTITDVLPVGLRFVSANGSGWSCSAANQTVTCASAAVLAVNATTSLEIDVAVSAAAAPGVVHAVTVATPGDVNPTNDSASDVTNVVATPAAVFVLTPAAPAPGTQAFLDVTLPAAFPHDITGRVTLAFSSNAAIPLDDPAIQFSTGGRQATFVIPANTLKARFTGNTIAGPIGFQTGTVAGALSFGGILQSGTVQTTFPQTGAGFNLTIPSQPPTVQSALTNGSAILIHLLSTTREVTQLSLTFFTTPTVTLSCGSVTGCSASGATITFDVKSQFDVWFNSDKLFGSLATLRVPFVISGTVHGTVAVKLRNSLGFSTAVSFPLP